MEWQIGWSLSAQQSQLASLSQWVSSGLKGVTWYHHLPHFRAVEDGTYGGHFHSASDAKCSESFREDNPDPKYQIPLFFCSCPENGQVRSVQKTNLQTIPSKLCGDMSRGGFLLLLLKCMKGECLGLCHSSEEQQFMSGRACLCSCAQARGSRAWTGSSCHQRTQLTHL